MKKSLALISVLSGLFCLGCDTPMSYGPPQDYADNRMQSSSPQNHVVEQQKSNNTNIQTKQTNTPVATTQKVTPLSQPALLTPPAVE